MKKKIISLSIVAMLAMAVAGCSSEEENIIMPDYTNLEVEDAELIEVSDEDVQGYIDYMLSAYTQTSETEITDRPAELGDTVNIDYVGLLDGVAFDGGTAEAQELELGSGTYLDGFEDGLVGTEAGDYVELELVFPEDYGVDTLNGQEVVFQVTVNSIWEIEEIVPEFTDEFVQEVSSTSTTTEEYYAEIYAMYEADNLATQETARETQVWTALIEATTVISYPDEEMEVLEQEVIDYYTDYASYYGITLEELVEMSDMTMDEFDVFAETTAQEIYISETVIQYIADEEGLDLTDDEYQTEIDAIVSYYGYESEDALYEETSRESIEMDILTDTVLAWLMDAVTFVDAVEDETVTEEIIE